MDDTDAVVPLRPGFDIQVRGFNRNQVIDHIEVLEDQLRMVTVDRNEAVRLNSDLRKLCEDTRNRADTAESRLERIESSDTGLPAASQRVQNMLTIAEEEVQTLRNEALRQADVIRGSAETEANALISEAEKTANELREECNELVSDVEGRRARLQREHDQKLSEQRQREYRLRQNIRNEYKRVLASAQEDADELIRKTRQQCAEWDAETEQRRMQAMEEIRVKQLRLEELRTAVLSAMDNAGRLLEQSMSNLRTEHSEIVQSEPPEVQLPEQREDAQTYTIPIEPRHTSNGIGPARQN